jgi:hypothetical protein
MLPDAHPACIIYCLTVKDTIVRQAKYTSAVTRRVAQQGERHAYTVDVTGSSPVPPTIIRNYYSGS